MPISWNALQNECIVKGERITLIGPHGIWKSATMQLPISIATTPLQKSRPAPYDDHFDDTRASCPPARRRRQLSATDWQAVASMEKEINRDLLTLRKHVLFLTEDVEASWRPRTNVDTLEELTDDGLLAETLALLTVAEYNVSLYQRLRLANIQATEPHQLASAIESAQAIIRQHNDADQQLTDHLRQTLSLLLKQNQLDVVSPFQKKRLELERQEADELLSWFVNQRSLVYEPLMAAERKGLRHVLDDVADIAKRGFDTATERLPGRSDSPLELTEGGQTEASESAER